MCERITPQHSSEDTIQRNISSAEAVNNILKLSRSFSVSHSFDNELHQRLPDTSPPSPQPSTSTQHLKRHHSNILKLTRSTSVSHSFDNESHQRVPDTSPTSPQPSTSTQHLKRPHSSIKPSQQNSSTSSTSPLNDNNNNQELHHQELQNSLNDVIRSIVQLGGGLNNITPPNQIQNSLQYVITNRSNYNARKFGLSGTDFRVRLTGSNGESYSNLINDFDRVIGNIVNEVLGDAANHHRVRFSVQGDTLDRSLNTKYIRRDQVSGHWLASLIGKMMQSHEEIDLDNGFSMSVQHVAIPNGRGQPRKHKLAVDMMLNIMKKYSVLTDVPDYEDIPCFGYAIVLGQLLLKNTRKEVFQLSRNKQYIKKKVSELFAQAGVPEGDVKHNQFQLFQDILPLNQRLIVLDVFSPDKLLFNGGEERGENVVCTILFKNHFYCLTSLTAWFGYGYYCLKCEKKYSSKSKHKCGNHLCHLCDSFSCLYKPKTHTYCSDCKGVFKNERCRINHKLKNICKNSSLCKNCGQWLKNIDAKHTCNQSTCSFCKKKSSKDHYCFIETLDPEKIDKFRHVYYDFECTQNDICDKTGANIHKPNYCVAMSSCNKCGELPCNDCKEIHTFSGLDKSDCLDSFCYWALNNPVNHGATFIAHNAGRYDSHFILKYLIENNEYPSIISQGAKFLCIEVKTCKAKFIDSFSFLSMPLSRFSSTFGIDNIEKGAFPHLFNTPTNYNYRGPLPALHYFCPDSMKPSSRSKLMKWHSEHSEDQFNFREEIKKYCIDDVKLLKKGCEMFRTSFIKDTGVDPFTTYTIAGACMKVYRSFHLQEHTIGRLPGEGLQFRRNYSYKSMQWLTWIEFNENVEMEHAWRNGEKKLEDANVWADGFDKNTNTVYSFFG